MIVRRKTKIVISLSTEERTELVGWQRSTVMRAGVVRRARVILLLSAGTPVSHVAQTVGMTRKNVYKWANRFLEKRMDGLADKEGRGRKSFFPCGGCGPHSKTGLRASRDGQSFTLAMGLR